MKPLKLFYVIAVIIVSSMSILSCSGDIASEPKNSLRYDDKATFGTASTHSPTVIPEGTASYSITPYKSTTNGQNLVLPTVDSSTGEVSVTATTTAGTYRVSAVEGGTTHTASFYVVIFTSTKQEINTEMLGDNTGIAMWGNTGDYNYIDTSAVTDMSFLFAADRSLTDDRSIKRPQYRSFNGDITLWDVSKVTNMFRLFQLNDRFNQDIGGWDVSQVQDMSFMFHNCIDFNQDLSNWRVDKVTLMYYMFAYASKFNQDISNWNVENVTSMHTMFNYASEFNQDISSWNVGKVTDFTSMFHHASKFNQDLEAWGKHLEGRTVKFSLMFDRSAVTTPPSWYPQ